MKPKYKAGDVIVVVKGTYEGEPPYITVVEVLETQYVLSCGKNVDYKHSHSFMDEDTELESVYNSPVYKLLDEI